MKNYIIFQVSTFWVIQHIHQQPAGFGPFHHGLWDREALCSAALLAGSRLCPVAGVTRSRAGVPREHRRAVTRPSSPSPGRSQQVALLPPRPVFAATASLLLAGPSPSPGTRRQRRLSSPRHPGGPGMRGRNRRKQMVFLLRFSLLLKAPVQ